ncbi:MAG: 23S rRNA (adenine(2503)-C(2))-methyltransferase RlmN [Clostridiales bacterium]|nr:23S rRNA (adenine(2503)-C(2))-methyltransferase RlmN [Clostridiales bacterium]
MPCDLLSLNKSELNNEFKEMNLPKFRINQIYSWLHQKLVSDYSEMTNIPVQLRQQLSEQYPLLVPRRVRAAQSSIDGTVKFLYSLYDGDYVESVLMKYKYGYTVCVSSQVGCKMGCAFCASTLGGFKRHLTAGEMLEQVYLAQKYAGERISHIVLMGMGEPLDNAENVFKFIEMVSNEDGLNISMRSISLSTSGVVPGIKLLLDRRYPLTLSVSLHAPNDEIRNRIMPVNKKYPVSELMEICREYSLITSRRISFEYAMINGLNDSDKAARELGLMLKGMLCHVNLIPINKVNGSPFSPSPQARVKSFGDILSKYGISVTVRRKLGSDIDASCGQLRRKVKQEEGIE